MRKAATPPRRAPLKADRSPPPGSAAAASSASAGKGISSYLPAHTRKKEEQTQRSPGSPPPRARITAADRSEEARKNMLAEVVEKLLAFSPARKLKA